MAADRLFESESEKVTARFFDPESLVSTKAPQLRVVELIGDGPHALDSLGKMMSDCQAEADA